MHADAVEAGFWAGMCGCAADEAGFAVVLCGHAVKEVGSVGGRSGASLEEAGFVRHIAEGCKEVVQLGGGPLGGEGSASRRLSTQRGRRCRQAAMHW
ncbi:hypothetical protein ZWY2020_034525 [Hordeum vulgare]|nr:hypothetical protein ZWY2020_034525 [Hordeum vulgare]